MERDDQPDAGTHHAHIWDEHGCCRNCAAIDQRQADDWRPRWRTPDTGEALVEMPDWARRG